MEIDKEVVGSLTYRGVLAYVAIGVLGDGKWTTAELAQAVSCNSSLMLEGMHELVEAAMIEKQKGTKWTIVGYGTTAAVQILDSEKVRRQDFLDDLKKYWDWGNPGVPFTMNASDGKAVQDFLKQHRDWDRPMWRLALKHRCMSEEVNHAQPLFSWVRRLVEYSAGPLNKFGRPMMNGGGRHGEVITTRQRNREAVERAVANA